MPWPAPRCSRAAASRALVIAAMLRRLAVGFPDVEQQIGALLAERRGQRQRGLGALRLFGRGAHVAQEFRVAAKPRVERERLLIGGDAAGKTLDLRLTVAERAPLGQRCATFPAAPAASPSPCDRRSRRARSALRSLRRAVFPGAAPVTPAPAWLGTARPLRPELSARPTTNIAPATRITPSVPDHRPQRNGLAARR